VASDYTISVETDKTTYAYWEPIVITVKINNAGDLPVFYAWGFIYTKFGNGYYLVRTVSPTVGQSTILGQGTLHPLLPGSLVNGVYSQSLVPAHAATGIAFAVHPQDNYGSSTLMLSPGKYQIQATVQISTISGGNPVPITASSAVILVK